MSPAALKPLIPLYRAAIAAKNTAYNRDWIAPKRLTWPVVSVGNLSVGGSGKTPLVIRLAQLLTAQGIHVDVLSRGYGRKSTEVARVDPSGRADHFGDEPLLIAQNAKVPIYVGASRYAAGQLAELESREAGIHLLDDGFQHRKLARSADIVVVHASDFQQDLLPAGRLREPFSALRRATIIVLRAEDAALESELRNRGIEAPIWIQHRRLKMELREPAIAFCGIARPEEFYAALKANGANLLATRSFRDHHRYTDADIESILNLAQTNGARTCITTEKDAVRLTPSQRVRLTSALRLQPAKLEISLADEPAAIRQLLALIVRK